ncbi:MAG: diguanylate cyclase (GGDEF)-like protein/PAS domain S-box-containing protein [Glaciecola sp.]|jgi:diguanylate cyclase (GGDEF)-like protein/PAS domain S-box-containing protein
MLTKKPQKKSLDLPCIMDTAWFEKCVNHLNDAIVITEAEPIDTPGPRILWANDVFYKNTGYEPSEIIGKSPRFLQGPLTDKSVLKKLRTALQKWQVCKVEVLNYKKDGSTFWNEFEVTPVANEDGIYTHWIAVQRDITERKQSEEITKKAYGLLKTAEKLAHIGSWEWDIAKDKFTMSDEWRRMHGVTKKNLTMDELIPIAHPDDAEAIETNFKEALDGLRSYDLIHRIIRQDNGEERIVLAKGIVSFDKQGKPYNVLGTAQDITQRKLAEKELDKHRNHLEVLVKERTHDLTAVNERLKTEIVSREKIELELVDKKANLEEAQRIANIKSWQLDIANGKVIWSEGLYNMYGFDPHQTAPSYTEQHKLFTPESWSKLSTAMSKTIDTGVPYELELEIARKDGKNRWIWARGEAIRNENGDIVNLHVVAQDITERKRAKEQLERIAHYDILTNMPNRVLLADHLNQAMLECKRRNRSLAVAFMDLDGFKAVNDLYGHNVGDELLIKLSQRMKEALREGDTLARIGGDEFIAVMVGLESIEDSKPVLKRLLKAAAEPVNLDDAVIQVSASIGVSLYPQDHVDADLLMRHADQAMYVAKQAGKSRYHFFDTAQDNANKTLGQSISEILKALHRREFVLHYQPKVNMYTGEVIGVEALIRWQHPVRGLVPPMEFLPAIEGHAVSLELGEWVLDTALSQINQWRSIGVNLPISVNISAYQLQQVNFTTRLAALLAVHSDVPSNCLELEILETSALQDISQISETMNACHDLGVRFALDDFGTGYSSLTYLKRLPAHMIKIDQSFVRDMLVDADDLAIIEGVVGLAKTFRRGVIAEGVETIAHGVALLQLGCELAQGYGIARPMPAGDIPKWASDWKADDSWKE